MVSPCGVKMHTTWNRIFPDVVKYVLLQAICYSPVTRIFIFVLQIVTNLNNFCVYASHKKVARRWSGAGVGVGRLRGT